MNKTKLTLRGLCKRAFGAAAALSGAVFITAMAPTAPVTATPLSSAPAAAPASATGSLATLPFTTNFPSLHNSVLDRIERSHELETFNKLQAQALSSHASRADKIAYQAFLFPDQPGEHDGILGKRTHTRAIQKRTELTQQQTGFTPYQQPTLNSLESIATAPCATDNTRLAFAVCVQNSRYTSGIGRRFLTLGAHGGSRVGQFHQGNDAAAPCGSEVSASSPAKVLATGNSNDYGNFVLLGFGSGAVVLTAHHPKVDVMAGDLISSGEVYALVGNTGKSTGCHTHAEIAAFDQASGEWRLASTDYLATRQGINATEAELLQSVRETRRRYGTRHATPNFINSLMNGLDGNDVSAQVAQLTNGSLRQALFSPLASIDTMTDPCRASDVSPLFGNPAVERVASPQRPAFRLFG